LPGAAGWRRRSDIRSAALAPQRLWEKRRGAVGPMGSESERHTAGAWVARAAQDAALRVDLDQLDGASAAPRRERFDRVTSLGQLPPRRLGDPPLEPDDHRLSQRHGVRAGEAEP